ncbi:hypothetical protein ABK040_005765 [Willaertia magna]
MQTKTSLFSFRKIFLIFLSVILFAYLLNVIYFKTTSSTNNNNENLSETNSNDNNEITPGISKRKEEETQIKRIKTKPKVITLWSTSFHISPIYCLKHFFKTIFEPKTGIKVNVIDKSLSGHCHLTKTCAHDLRVLDKKTATGDDGTCPVEYARKFYNSYKDDSEFKEVDAVVCDHNISIFEMYMAFDIPLIVWATTRYEVWRFQKERWQNLNENLKLISQKPYNAIIANNLYDSKYVNYFTGLNVPVVDSYCGYAADNGNTYNPSRKEILIGPSHLHVNPHEFFSEVFSKSGGNIKLEPIRSLYPHYEYSDLAKHPAIVIVPYQVSVMSFFEYYRMGIPMYFPSLDLLTKLQVERNLLNERTWYSVSNGRRHSPGSTLPKHGSIIDHNYDPNNDRDSESVKYWLQYSDLYQWPHIIIFNDMNDLYEKLSKATPEYYAEISKKMMEHNKVLQERLINYWKKQFELIERKTKVEGKQVFNTYEEAMKKLWNKSSIQCDV